MALTEEQEKALLEMLAKKGEPPQEPPQEPPRETGETVSKAEYDALKARADEQARLLAVYGYNGEKSDEEKKKEEEQKQAKNKTAVSAWIKTL